MPKYYAQFDFSGVPLKNVVIDKGTTAPASPVVDQLWTDTTTTPHLLKIYDGSAWTAIGYVADGSITTAKLADGAVTNAKLAGGIANSKLATDPLARANHTGSQSASTISDLASVVQGYSLSDFADLTGDLDLQGFKVTNAGAGTGPNDLATQGYVDASRAGFRGAKDPVRVVAPAGFNTSAPGAAIDGVTLANGDRFLVPDSGIYVFNGAGTAATADNTGVSDGTTVAVAEGTEAGYIYIQRADTEGGATADWGVFQAGGIVYGAGSGLTLTGSTFSLPTVDVAHGGTGATTAQAARDNLFAAAAYGETVPSATLSGAGATANINHGLNTLFIGVFTTLDGSGERIELDWKVVDADNVQLSSEVALPGDVNVCVVGA